MKKIPLLLFLFCLAACSKDTVVKPVQDISGTYNTNVHYLHTWMQSQSSYGTVLDTNYTASFNIGYSNDTITVSYMDVHGSGVTEKLVYQSATSVGDTLRFAGPWNGYSYKNTYLSFNTNVNQFTYTWKDHTNPSGGGNDINYTINSQ